MAYDYINHTRNSLFRMNPLYIWAWGWIHSWCSFQEKKPKNIHVSCSRASRAGSASGSDSLKSADSNQHMYWLYWQPYNQSNSSWNETQKHLTNCHSRIVKRVTADLETILRPCTWRNGSKVILVLFYLFWQNLHLSSLSHSCFTCWFIVKRDTGGSFKSWVFTSNKVFEYSRMYLTINCNVGWIQHCSNLQQHQSFLALSTKFI